VVGGFSVPEIARAFLSPPSTIAQRIVRAKRKLRAVSVPVEIPGAADLPSRLDAVLEVLYLMFNEGYDASQGDQLVRGDLCQEALRLVSLLAEWSCTATPRTHALAALLFFQGGRLTGRMDAAGDILLLEGQDRSRWDRSLIGKGAEYMARSAEGEQLSAYHLEAEIASCHALAPCFQETDWPRILSCYDALYQVNPSPVVALNRIVAVWQVRGAESAWQEGRQVFQDPALCRYASTHIAKGQLLGELDRFEEARMALDRALEMSVSDPVRRFLVNRRNLMTERVTVD
jgi:RNA polymerase sigma-70 factor (ECF subfamily)